MNKYGTLSSDLYKRVIYQLVNIVQKGILVTGLTDHVFGLMN